MSIILKEYLESSPVKIHKSEKNLHVAEGYNALNLVAKDSIMADIEGIHVGPTNNYTWYTEKALKNSVQSWTKPYRKPFILHHNERDGKIIGRVLDTIYTDINTRSGTGALIFTCNVSDEEGKKGVRDGRFETVSIGVVAHDVKCSICGHSISDDGECEHERGATYDEKKCYWIIDEMEAKELSYVIVPSDVYAHNIRIYEPTNKDIEKYEEGEGNTMNGINLKEGEEKVKEKEEPKKNPEKAVEEVKEEKKDIKEIEKVKEIEEEVKEKIQEESKTIESLEDMIKKLEIVITDLKKQLESEKALKDEAETELVTANEQLKEYVIERILTLREQLEKPVILKESLEKRTKLSLIDNIRDLEEEINFTPESNINIKEADDTKVENISLVPNSALVDNKKDNSQKIQENLSLNVKEGVLSSNTVYETTCKLLTDFYNL